MKWLYIQPYSIDAPRYYKTMNITHPHTAAIYTNSNQANHPHIRRTHHTRPHPPLFIITIVFIFRHSIIRLRKQEYFTYIIEQNKGDICKTWKIDNEIMGRQSINELPLFINELITKP